MEQVAKKLSKVAQLKALLKETSVNPDEVNHFLHNIGSSSISEKQKIEKILLRPDVELTDLAASLPWLKKILAAYTREEAEQTSIQIKYDTYIAKERELVNRMAEMEEQIIPESFDYTKLPSLRNEAREKLHKIKPRTLGQASRISGINPADVQILMVYMGR